MGMTGKTLLTRFHTFVRFINGPQLVAVILQIMRPPPEPGRDFQNRVRGQTLANPRKNCAGPLRGRATPGLRPFLARLFPDRTSFIEWLGAESNRRHETQPSRIHFSIVLRTLKTLLTVQNIMSMVMTVWLQFTKTRAANLHSFTVLSRCRTANVASNRRN